MRQRRNAAVYFRRGRSRVRPILGGSDSCAVAAISDTPGGPSELYADTNPTDYYLEEVCPGAR